MKYCNVCNQEKEASEFHKRKASNDGLAARCKSCQREYDNARLRNPKRMNARREYQKTEKGKLAHGKAAKKWVEKNAIKRACHIMVGNAVRRGELVRLDCEVCGRADSRGHHDDYSNPLVVRWLCDDHHNEWHRINGEGKNAT